MTEPQQQGGGRKRPPRKRNRGRGSRPNDLWRPVPALGDPDPIIPVPDPTALLRSLGDPPLHGQGMTAEHYLAAVVEKAAGLAVGLAAVNDLLGRPADD